MHQEINRSAHQKDLCTGVSANERRMRMLFKQISLELMVKFIKCALMKEQVMAVHCFALPQVCFFGNSVFINER